MASPLKYPPLLERISQALPTDLPIHLVGGAVRDLLLGDPIHDYDFALPGKALKIGRQLADDLGAAYFPLDEERGTARVIYTDKQKIRNVLDFAAYRGPTLESDLYDRDFTINAMALDLRRPQKLLDPLGGAADLQSKRLRACSPNSLNDDPVRVLRAVRLASNFGMQIESGTRQLMRDAVPGLHSISPERQRDELLRILNGPQPHTSIRALEMLGVLPYVFPELPDLFGVTQSAPHVNDVWNHTLDTLRVLEGILNLLTIMHDPQASGNLMLGQLSMRLGRYREQIKQHLDVEIVTDRPTKALLFWAALYHDVAKPQTRTVEDTGKVRFFNHAEIGAEIITRRAEAFHLSRAEIERLALIIRHHMRPSFLSHAEGGPSKRAIYRFFRDTGEAGIDICLLSLADLLATYGPTLPPERWEGQIETVRSLLAAWWETSEDQISPPALITGKDLISELKLKPGPDIGKILEAVREAQVAGDVKSRAEALIFAKQYLR